MERSERTSLTGWIGWTGHVARALLTLALPVIPALVLADSAQALQVIDASDGVAVQAVMSLKEPTRIRIEGAPIVNAFGNIYANNCSSPIPGAGPAAATSPMPSSTATAAPINSGGELVLECDAEKGEIYVRPVGAAAKPVNLFISSRDATYTLLLRRSDTPADTIVIRDRTPRRTAPVDPAPPGTAPARAPQHVRALKSMLSAMASDRLPSDIRVEDTHQPIALWAETSFALTRLFEGRGLIGERYRLTNLGAEDMVLAEQEFDREGAAVLAVAIEHHNLRPGTSTVVYVIRQGN